MRRPVHGGHRSCEAPGHPGQAPHPGRRSCQRPRPVPIRHRYRHVDERHHARAGETTRRGQFAHRRCHHGRRAGRGHSRRFAFLSGGRRQDRQYGRGRSRFFCHAQQRHWHQARWHCRLQFPAQLQSCARLSERNREPVYSMIELSTVPPVAGTRPPAILSLIGDTPLVEITRMDTGPCQLFLKLENQNPTGSIKDRIALSMIEAAERDGKLEPGGTIIEATAGNTGLGLALIAGAKGYRCVLVIPDKMSQEKVAHVRALGAEVRMTRADVTRGHPEYYQDMAARLATEIPGSFYVNQFGNPANPLAHERGTGPEIWEQMGHHLDAIVVGVGSGGPLTGLGRFFERVQPNLEMILADPAGSILYEWVKTGKLEEAGSWRSEEHTSELQP